MRLVRDCLYGGLFLNTALFSQLSHAIDIDISSTSMPSPHFFNLFPIIYTTVSALALFRHPSPLLHTWTQLRHYI